MLFVKRLSDFFDQEREHLAKDLPAPAGPPGTGGTELGGVD